MGVSAKQVGFQRRKELRLGHQKPDSQAWGRNPEEPERRETGEEMQMEAFPPAPWLLLSFEASRKTKGIL